MDQGAPQLTKTQPLVIAHRGASAVRPENTIEAFLEARRMGADMVELDVRRTADGALAIHHDPALAGLGPIVALTRAELPVTVALLDEAIEACAPMGVNIEIKNAPNEPDWDEDQWVAGAVAEFVTDRGWQRAVVVSSFNLAAIDRVRAVDPAIPTAWLTLPDWDQRRSAVMARDHGHQGLHPHHLAVNAELVSDLHDDGMFCNTWTVDDPERMKWLAAAGVDGICTNVPDIAVAAMGDK